MKKNVFVLLFIFIFGLGALFSSNSALFSSASAASDVFMIRAYGDSISAGYGLSDTSKAYPAVFAQPYTTNFEATFVAKGVSGDTSTQLLTLLESEEQADFDETEIFTLCIGANNVLGVATSNLASYITGSLTDADYRVMLAEGVEQFKTDYPLILEKFAGKKIAVMTIYNPYKYMSLMDMDYSALGNFGTTIIKTFDNQYQAMLATTMEYLQQINDEIRNSASGDIYVADIWTLFDGFSEEQYLQYINADISQVVLESSDLTNTSALVSKITTACDPHPTVDGHAVIAQENLDTFKYFELVSQTDFSQIKDTTDTATFTVNTFEEGAFTYKLFKNVNGVSTLLSTSTILPLSVPATSINGSGELYVEVYENSSLIATTYSIDYVVSLNEFSISCDDGLSGVKDEGESVTIKLNATETEGYTFKLFKLVSSTATLLKEGSSDFVLNVSDLVGSGLLYVEVYKNGALVLTTNSLEFSISLNSFILTSDSNLNTTIFDNNETIGFQISATTTEGYTFKLYKKVDGSSSLLATNETGLFEISVTKIEGIGEIYVQVLKNSSVVCTTESIAYNVTVNKFSISCDDLTGIKDKNETIKILLDANRKTGYTYRLYKKLSSQPILVKQYTSPTIEVSASSLDGAGQLYLEVYKSGTLIYTTNSLNFNLTVGTFEITTTTNLKSVASEEQVIVINVNSVALTNPVYKLYNQVNGQSSELKSNSLGIFEITAKEIEGDGILYVEIYSDGEYIITTNTLEYSISFKESAGDGNGLTGTIFLYSSLAFTAGLVVFLVVLIIIKNKRKTRLF